MKNKKQASTRLVPKNHSWRRAWYAGVLSIACGMVSVSAHAQETFNLPPVKDPYKPPIIAILDYAKLIEIPEETRTVILGNSGIVDVQISGKNRAIVTGKGFGYTNFILIDKNGKILSEDLIRVTKTTYKKVTIRKGKEQFTYMCDPNCEMTVELGDNRGHLSEAGGGISARASMARGS